MPNPAVSKYRFCLNARSGHHDHAYLAVDGTNLSDGMEIKLMNGSNVWSGTIKQKGSTGVFWVYLKDLKRGAGKAAGGKDSKSDDITVTVGGTPQPNLTPAVIIDDPTRPSTEK
jgi:hypothetical protein